MRCQIWRVWAYRVVYIRAAIGTSGVSVDTIYFANKAGGGEGFEHELPSLPLSSLLQNGGNTVVLFRVHFGHFGDSHFGDSALNSLR
jgi:hypothetical protein